jgi:polysaccharide biosynthesis protein PslH
VVLISKKKILVLSAHPPLPNSREAGQKVFYEFLKILEDDFDIYLITFARREELNWGIEESVKICEAVSIIEQNLIQKMIAGLSRPWMPIIHNARYNKHFINSIKEYTLKYNFEYVHFEWEQMLQYMNHVSNIKYKTVDCHDIISQMYERKEQSHKHIKKVFFKFQKIVSRVLEKRYFNKLNLVLSLNKKDEQLIKEIMPGAKTQVFIPHFIKCASPLLDLNDKKYDLVFFGAMNRIENEDGIIWFINEILPIVKRNLGNVSLAIVGNKPSDRLKNLINNNPSIILTGFVEDPYQIIMESRVGIVPLRMGAGIKIKTLEFLSHGIPVVATTVGAEGINANPENGLFVEDNLDLFAKRIIKVLGNQVLQSELGKKAHLFIDNNFDIAKNKCEIKETFSVINKAI